MLKGAVDGGLAVPHNSRRFPGYDAETKQLDAEVHRSYIFGEHVANYMRELEEEDDESFKRQFSKAIALDLGADDMEAMYTKAHEQIRANPVTEKETFPMVYADKKAKPSKRNLAERKNRIKQKKEAFLRKLDAEREE